MAKRRRRSKRSQESRRRLLSVGHEMVLSAPSPDLLAHIRFSDIAERAGVSTGALYHYWDSQEDFRVELLRELLSPRLYEIPESVDSMVRDAASGGMSLHELLNHVCRENVDQFLTNRDFWIQLAFWLSDDAEVLGKLRDQYAAVADQWVEFYRTVFSVYGLRLREPFTFEWIATALTALLEGLILRARVDPASVPLDGFGPGDKADWGFFSLGVLALLPSVSCPQRGKGQDIWAWSGDRSARLVGGRSVEPESSP